MKSTQEIKTSKLHNSLSENAFAFPTLLNLCELAWTHYELNKWNKVISKLRTINIPITKPTGALWFVNNENYDYTRL